MTKRLLAMLCALAIFVPVVSPADEFQAIFPAGSNFAVDLLTSSSLDGVHHQHLGVNLVSFDLFVVAMLSTGTPSLPGGKPWLYGKIVLIEQLDDHTFRVTWNVSLSANGTSFAPAGTLVLTFVV